MFLYLTIVPEINDFVLSLCVIFYLPVAFVVAVADVVCGLRTGVVDDVMGVSLKAN